MKPAAAPAAAAPARGVRGGLPERGVDAGVPTLERSGLTILSWALGSGSRNGLLRSDITGYAIPDTEDTERRCSCIIGGNVGGPPIEFCCCCCCDIGTDLNSRLAGSLDDLRRGFESTSCMYILGIPLSSAGVVDLGEDSPCAFLEFRPVNNDRMFRASGL